MSAEQQGAALVTDRWLTMVRSLCFITHGSDVLLMKRADHKRIFPGYYNGIGGHVERGEDPYTGALREIREETGLEVRRLQLRGISTIDAGAQTGITLFIFTAETESRQTSSCEEGTLHWVPIGSALELPLVEDLPVLLPKLFGPESVGAPFFARVSYDQRDKMVMCFAQEV